MRTRIDTGWSSSNEVILKSLWKTFLNDGSFISGQKSEGNILKTHYCVGSL